MIDATPRILIRPLPPGVEAGIDEAMIHELVHAFYTKLRADGALGPIFSSIITDWEPHLAKMCDFWSSMLLMTKRYQGRPVPAHVKIAGLEKPHFALWLAIFETTAHEICPPAAAALFVDRAHRVAQSLQLALDFDRGILPPLKMPVRAG